MSKNGCDGLSAIQYCMHFIATLLMSLFSRWLHSSCLQRCMTGLHKTRLLSSDGSGWDGQQLSIVEGL